MLAVLGNRAAAEDCTQDAFVLAFRAWARWRPDAPAEAWLHRIAINVAVSYHRKASLRSIGTILQRMGRPAAGPDPAQVALDRDLTDAIFSEGLKGDLIARGAKIGLVLDVGGYYKNVFTLAPCFNITDKEIDLAVELLEQLGSVLPAQSGGNNRTGPGKNSEADLGKSGAARSGN